MKNIFLASLIAICGSLSAQDIDCGKCAEQGCPPGVCPAVCGCNSDVVSPDSCVHSDQNCYDQKAKAERQLKKTQTTTIEATHTEQVD